MAAPYPKPTALRLIEGNPGKRALPVREPKPDGLLPRSAARRCPPYLVGTERWWWRHYFRLLASIRVLTEADLVALEKLAKVTAERVKHEETLARTGPLLIHKSQKRTGTDKDGKAVFAESQWPMVSPLWSIVSTLREFELKMLREFGMTPSARARVSMVGPSGADAIEEALA